VDHRCLNSSMNWVFWQKLVMFFLCFNKTGLQAVLRKPHLKRIVANQQRHASLLLISSEMTLTVWVSHTPFPPEWLAFCLLRIGTGLSGVNERWRNTTVCCSPDYNQSKKHCTSQCLYRQCGLFGNKLKLKLDSHSLSRIAGSLSRT